MLPRRRSNVVKRKEEVNGGSNPVIVVEDEPREPSEPELESEAELEEPEISPEALVAVNEAMIETALKVLNKVLVLLTNIEEIAFDDEEIEQLKALWSPVIPVISPLAGAIVGTSIIVAGKIAIYVQHKRMEKSVTESKVKSPLTEEKIEKVEES
jgi:hypothetical protein